MIITLSINEGGIITAF